MLSAAMLADVGCDGAVGCEVGAVGCDVPFPTSLRHVQYTTVRKLNYILKYYELRIF